MTCFVNLHVKNISIKGAFINHVMNVLARCYRKEKSNRDNWPSITKFVA